MFFFSSGGFPERAQKLFRQYNAEVIQGNNLHPIECDIVLDWDGFAGPHYMKFLEQKRPLVISFSNDLIPNKRNDFIISFESIADFSHLKNERDIKQRVWVLPNKAILGFLGESQGLPYTDLPMRTNGFVSFGAFSFNFKLTDITLKIWGEILRSIPDSKFEICNPCYEMPQCRKWLLKKFADQGIKASRISFSTISGYPTYCHQFPKYDIILGACPYVGGRTSSHMAENGFFQLSWVKHDFVNARFSQSLFLALGVPELVLKTPDEYVKMAQFLAANPEKIIEIRSKIKNTMDDYRANHAGEMTRLVEELLLKAHHSRNKKMIQETFLQGSL